MFQHYKHATALHHFKAINKILKNIDKLALLFRNTHKNEQKGSF